jgi:hypothetical protein
MKKEAAILRRIIREELSMITEAASDDQDSIDRQIDALLLQYEKSSAISKKDESKTLRSALGYLFEEEEEGEGEGEPTPAEDPDAASDEEVKDMIEKLKKAGYDVRLTVDNSSVAVDDPGEEVQNPLNSDVFAERITRLISNFNNLIDVETTIRNRARQFMLDRYDKDSADEVDEKLDTLMRPSGTMNDEPETPIAVGAGASKLA